MKKIKLFLSIFRFLPWTIYFNFKYLPFNQASKLPILLYKPRLVKCKGKVIITSNKLHFGMIRMGFFNVSIYPNSGIMWENNGGIVVFKDRANIGNNSYISVNKNAKIECGENFSASCSLKLISYKSITFGNNVLIGWENTIMDTDFHKITRIGGGYLNTTKPIIIGDNNWLSMNCLVLKGSETPNYCIVGARSLLNKKYDFPSYCLISGNPVKLNAVQVYRNPDDDIIE